jgi:hypothetical protein
MANEIENTNSTNGEEIVDVVLDDNDDTEVLKEKFEKVTETNKKLYARAKKAEGFVLEGDKWVKPPKEEKTIEKLTENKTNAKPSELDYGQLAFHNTKADSVRIEAEDDIEFLKQTMADTGKSQQAILNSKWFVAELKEKQEARKTTDATPKGNKRTVGNSGDDLSVAIAKYKETGKLPEDQVLREKVVDSQIASETSGRPFYNS